MRVQKSPGGQEQAYILNEGDTVTCGITHEIKIGGEKSWVNYAVTRKVPAQVPADEFTQSLQSHVDQQVIQNITQTVTTVRNQS